MTGPIVALLLLILPLALRPGRQAVPTATTAADPIPQGQGQAPQASDTSIQCIHGVNGINGCIGCDLLRPAVCYGYINGIRQRHPTISTDGVIEIKFCYRELARQHHPDLGGSLETMKVVNIVNAQYHEALKGNNGKECDGRKYTYNSEREQQIMDKVSELLTLPELRLSR